MKFTKITLCLAMLGAMCGATTAHAVRIIDKENTKAVGHVKWHKEASIDTNSVINANVPDNATNLVFIRQADLDPLQTSANIAVNDRFQVSLQPGNHSQVYSCAGINVLSSDITGVKHNDLYINNQTHNLAGGATYYFYLEVDEQGKSTLKQVDNDSAKALLENTNRQVHQISRVVPNCPAPATPPPPKPVPAPIVETPAKQTLTIELEVLFDTDKHFVKSKYHEEIKRVSDFMQQHPHATVVIEGHTDSRASEAYNQALSERRAKAVKDVLVKTYGVDESAVTTEGHGELRPRATNDTAEGRQLNRRVMAVFTY
ncbi:OmpA family protein [Moraxella equi]|uniref:Cell envelope biogenesis protein OmpA n=1 Tax=Moraxella equi TaxID=60442 RepID=A0A378QUG4_9GAMM|nr:OmpA family protein [Moraxella equi]OPH34206.1 cell envelope biogenesis protein OmpA [Moraxella equi]STZ04311.1 Outer membrane porin F precursor [Moraxella equi]